MCNLDYRPVVKIYDHPVHGARTEVGPSFSLGIAYQPKNSWSDLYTIPVSDAEQAISSLARTLGLESFHGLSPVDKKNPNSASSAHFRMDLRRIGEVRANLAGILRSQ